MNNLILIPVLLDNKIPLEFLLDTGVKNSILTDRLYSDVLNISYDRVLSLKGAGEADLVTAYVASSVQMLLPNVQVKNQPLLVLEEDYLELGSQLGIPVHGIMGYDLFSRFVVKIDYDRNLITLYEPHNFKAPRSYERLDLTIENAKPYIWTEVTDDRGEVHRLKLLLDTGASHSLLLHQNHSKKGVPLPRKTLYGNLGRGLLGDIEGHIGRLPLLSLAGRNFKNVLVSFPEDSSYDVSSQAEERDGTLGGEVLSRFSIIFDYPQGAIYVKKSKAFKRPFIFSKTGLNFSARGEDLQTVVITDVRKGSTAEAAGILKYDVLYKVNGWLVNGARMSSIGEMLRKRDGKKVRLVILRNGEKIKIRLALKEII